jgi:hypothetical protein
MNPDVVPTTSVSPDTAGVEPVTGASCTQSTSPVSAFNATIFPNAGRYTVFPTTTGEAIIGDPAS